MSWSFKSIKRYDSQKASPKTYEILAHKWICPESMQNLYDCWQKLLPKIHIHIENSRSYWRLLLRPYFSAISIRFVWELVCNSFKSYVGSIVKDRKKVARCKYTKIKIFHYSPLYPNIKPIQLIIISSTYGILYYVQNNRKWPYGFVLFKSIDHFSLVWEPILFTHKIENSSQIGSFILESNNKKLFISKHWE